MANVPNLQFQVDGIDIAFSSCTYSIESGLVQVDTVCGVLWSQSNKILTIEVEAPPLEDGDQIKAWNAIVKEQLVEPAFLFAGGLTWRSTEGRVLNCSGGQSAGAGQTQSVTIVVPLNTVPQ